jgi:hypothetical protein
MLIAELRGSGIEQMRSATTLPTPRSGSIRPLKQWLRSTTTAINPMAQPADMNLRANTLIWASFAMSALPGSLGKANQSAGREVRAPAGLI